MPRTVRLFLVFLMFMGLASISWAFGDWRLAVAAYIIGILFYCALCVIASCSYKKIVETEAEMKAYAKAQGAEEIKLTKEEYKTLNKNGFVTLKDGTKITKDEVKQWKNQKIQ